MCSIIIPIICEWHAEVRGVGVCGEDSLRLKNGKSGW